MAKSNKTYHVTVWGRTFRIEHTKEEAIEYARVASIMYWNSECKVLHANGNQVKGTPTFVNGMEIKLDKMTQIDGHYLFVSRNRDIFGNLHLHLAEWDENGHKSDLTENLFDLKDYPENFAAVKAEFVDLIESLGIAKETSQMLRDKNTFYAVYEFDLSKLPMYTEGGEK